MNNPKPTFTQLAFNYFENKIVIKILKKKRLGFKRNCSNTSEEEKDIKSIYFSCIDRFKQNKEEKLCPNCQKRHNIYLEIQRLAHANSGLLTKINNLIFKGQK